MIHLRPQNMRARLTVWYVAVLAAILLLYGAGISTVFYFASRAQLDDHSIEELETIEGSFGFRPDGTLSLNEDYHDHPMPSIMRERFIEVRDYSGTVLYRSPALKTGGLGGDPRSDEGVDSYEPRSFRLANGTRVRLISKRHVIEGRTTLIRLGLSEEGLWRSFFQVAAGLIVGFPLALGLAGLGGYLLAGRSLAPIEAMARRAKRINAEQLNERLEVENPRDELGLLASAFNDTLSRLERSFEHLRRFTADAAHELRTPLTAIRTVGEVGLQKHADSEDYREVISSMLEEAGSLTRLIEDLLTMARADSGDVELKRTNIQVLPFVHEVVSLLEVLAEEKNQTISVECNTDAYAFADRGVLRQVLLNLLDNAIKYSPEGARVTARIRTEKNLFTVIEVEDTGPGIPVEHRTKIFERFYRIDGGRSRRSGGTGLGLAIAQWGANAHGGCLDLDSAPGGGCIFRISLPPLPTNAA